MDSMPEAAAVASGSDARSPGQQPRLYRRCPVCNVLMNRKGCGEVVLDVCTLHGVWFDRGELEAFAGWVQAEAERHLRVLPGAATERGATIAASLLAVPPDPNRESRWLDAFESLELLEPVVMLLEAVCGLFDI